MTKKIFLTSILAMCIACPAFAKGDENIQTSDTFPEDGYMQENTVYYGQAVQENMHAYSGTVYANAEFENTTYQLKPGTYLSTEDTIETCPEESYCPGESNATYNENSPVGIYSCSDVGDGTYTLSVGGTKSSNRCYKSCSLDNLSMPGANGVKGKVYYDSLNPYSVGTCEPTSCQNGYYVVHAVDPDVLYITMPGTAAHSFAFTNGYGEYAEERDDAQYHYDRDYYGIGENEQNMFAVNYGGDIGVLKGTTWCSQVSGTNDGQTWGDPTIFSAGEAWHLWENGQVGSYCFCSLMDSTTGMMFNSDWILLEDYSNSDTDCRADCTRRCASYLASNEGIAIDFKSAIFHLVQPSFGYCAGNRINIIWSDTTAEDIEANEAGWAVYGDDIRTPRAVSKPKGKTFKGWKFELPAGD